MASTEYERDKYLGRIHGKNQFTLVGNTLNAPDINATTITGSTVTGSTALFTTVTGSTALFTTVTGSTVTGSTALFTTLTASEGFISGGLTVGNYIQMLPVGNVNIPTNQTASYIYTSGSTNDLYFTQYQPGTNFTNTTRLRWLEGSLSTGLLHGGTLSTVNGTTTFNVASGSGIIVSYNATTTVDPYPTIKYVEWNNFVSQSLIYSGSAQITYVAIDDNGAISQLNAAFTNEQFKDRIILGRVLHQTGSVTNGTISTPTTAYAISSNTQDFFRAFGPLKVSGQILAASGSTLGLTRTAGDSYVEGRNYTANPNSPNFILAADDPALTTTKIFYEWVSGSTVNIDTNGGVGYTAVRPAFYNLNGTVTAISPTNNKYTVQRVYWFPKSVTRALFVYYGSTIYTTLSEALAAINNEPDFIEGDNTRSSAVYIGAIVLEANTTDLTVSSKAQIVNGGLFRGAGGGGGGGGGGTTSPGGVNHAIQFNDAGTFNGSSNFTFDTTTLTLNGNFNIVGTGSIDFDGGTLTGSLARFTTMSGSVITGSTALYTTITGSTVTGSNALFTLITGSTITGSDALFTTITGSTVTGSTALFTNITASSLTADLATKVSKTGDTMTGPLVINSNSTITGSLIVTGSITTQTQLDFDAVAEPTNAVTLTLAGVAGNVNVGSHYYYVSFVTALGETSFFFGTEPFITTTAGNQQVIISNIPVSPDPRVTARRIYRNGANQARFNDLRILTTINDNTTTTYTDNIADASRTGAANYYFRENTTCRYITKDTTAAMFVGTNCTSFGQGALATLNAGTHTGGTNTCIGRNAGYLLSTGNQNIIISNSSIPITTGDSNVLIHGNWGNNPSNCVMIGRNAGSQNSGASNVAIGSAAGSSGHNNGISIGVNSNTNVTGQGNIAIGVNAGNYSATAAGAFNINIGSGARSLTSGSSGQINIGNVIYGVNAYQSTTADSTPTATGRMGIGLTTPTARLHLPAGTTAASMAPLKFTSGSLLATPESGSMEYDGDKLHLTITSSSARKEFTLNDTALTSGSIPVATTNGRLTNSNIYSVYNTGTTAGTAGTSVSLKVLTFTTSNEFRFLRLAVRGVYPTGGEAFARTINAAWGSGSMGMMQTGADELGTLMFSGTKLDGATIQTSGSGADIYVKCTDVEGAGGTVTWVVAGEYF